MAKKKKSNAQWTVIPAIPIHVNRVELFKAVDGQWCWRCIANNGQTLDCSEPYTTIQKCRQTAEQMANALRVDMWIEN